MADVLPGYTYDRTSGRYRDASTGRYVSRDTVTQLLDDSVADAETRMNNLSDAYIAGDIAPAVYVDQMKTEVKRQHMQQAALAKGGFDKLDQSDYGRVGAATRDLYPKIVGTAEDVQKGEVSEAQLHQRNTAYAGSARTLYHRTERSNPTETEPDQVQLEKRTLDPAAEHCEDCISYAGQGWQMAGSLPVPGEQCACRHNCRCSLIKQTVSADEVSQYLGESEAMNRDDKNLVEMESSGEFIPLIEKAMRRDGTIPLKVIQPGWGSSGYYSPELLERDGPNVFRAGTQMFWDHQTATDEAERPEGSLSNLAAVLVSDARWDAQGADGPGLYADAKPFGEYKEAIEELAPHIGVSIRASGRASQGEADGRKGPVIESITSAKSIDFVTKPGAGGKVIEMFEAARPGTDTADQVSGVESATPTDEEHDDMSEQLAKQLTEATGRLEQLEQTNARLQEALLLRDARDFVSTHIAGSTLPDVTKSRLVESLVQNPPIAQGQLDRDAYATRIDEAVKTETEYLQQVSGYGSGRITGMGSASQQGGGYQDVDDAAIQKRMADAFQRMGLNESESAHAANGRVW